MHDCFNLLGEIGLSHVYLQQQQKIFLLFSHLENSGCYCVRIEVVKLEKLFHFASQREVIQDRDQ